MSLLLLALLTAHPAGDDPVAIRAALLRLFASEERRDRIRAAEQALEAPGEVGVRFLLEKLVPEEQDAEVRDRALHHLGKLRDPAAQALYVAAAAKPAGRKQLVLIDGLGSLPTQGARALLSRSIVAPDPRVRAVAAHALGYAHKKSARDELLKALQDSLWPVRAAALASLRRVKDRGSVPGLIDALERERGRLQHETAQVLRDLTGVDLGLEVLQWRSWWEAQREAGGGRPAAGRAGEPRYAGPTYYGIRLVTNRVVFVLDLSGSMRDPVEPSENLLRRLPPEDRPLVGKEIKNKLELAKSQLARAVQALPEEASFSLVFFSDSPFVWEKSLVPATAENKKRALQRVESAGASGGTNIHDALRATLELGGEDALERFAQGPDTVFLLTDGNPSRGELRDPRLLQSWFGDENLPRRIRVNTIGVGRQAARFLKGMAEDSGGEFISLR
jgi:hypothetical protein